MTPAQLLRANFNRRPLLPSEGELNSDLEAARERAIAHRRELAASAAVDAAPAPVIVPVMEVEFAE